MLDVSAIFASCWARMIEHRRFLLRYRFGAQLSSACALDFRYRRFYAALDASRRDAMAEMMDYIAATVPHFYWTRRLSGHDYFPAELPS